MPEPDRFSRFTEHVRRLLSISEIEARRLNHHFEGTEHLLLALLQVPDGVGAKVLQGLDVDPNVVCREVEAATGRGDGGGPDQIGLAPGAKRVIVEAVNEARRLGHHYLGTEHLLLCQIREGEGIAARVLEGQGVGPERARLRTIQLLDDLNDTSEIGRGGRGNRWDRPPDEIDRGDRRGWGKWLWPRQ